jgi:cobalt transporter subunit CbtA
MIFTRIIFCSVLIGIATGLLLSLLQVFTLDPIIFQAETYEVVETSITQPKGHENHDHDHSGWAPADGSERTLYTVLSNISAGVGFSAVILALMSQFWLPRRRALSLPHSLLWGLAGFTALYFAPGIGLPPEIPGIQAAPVEQRQIWWALTAICVGVGLGTLAWAPIKMKAIGLLFLVVPYLVGAPSHQGPDFVHSDPVAVQTLTELHQQFIITSGVVNLLFWIALGLACGVAFNRWFSSVVLADEHPV